MIFKICYGIFQATVAETHRLAAIAPLALGHQTRGWVEVEGFTFPPGSDFMSNLQFIMRDPSNFDNPETFNPERFIGEDGRLALVLMSDRFYHFTVYCQGIRNTQPWCPSVLVRGCAWGRPWLGTRSCSSLSASYRDSPSSLLLLILGLTQRITLPVLPGCQQISMFKLFRITYRC